MASELCPDCGKELEKGVCSNCGYEKPKMPFNLPTSSSGGRGYAFASEAQRRAFFAWLRETGRYDPNYRGRSSSPGRTSVSSTVIPPTIAVAKTMARLTSPALGTAITGVETAYTGYKEVSNAITDIRKIWRSRANNSDRLSGITNRLAEAGGNISKQAGAQIIAGVSGEMASLLVESVDSSGGFDFIEKATGIHGIGDVCKDILIDMAENELQRRLAA